MSVTENIFRENIMKLSTKFAGTTALFAAILCPSLASAQTTVEKQEQKKADPGQWRLGTGISYSEGDYGDTQKTKVIAAPVSLKYKKGPIALKISVPYIHISGPGSLIDSPQGRDGGFNNSGSGSSGSSNSGPGSSGSGSSGSGSSGSGSSGSGSSGSSGSGGTTVGSNIVPGGGVSGKRSGIGDVSLGLVYTIDFGNDFYADVSGKVKLPTASKSKNIGTGKVDWTAGVDLIKDIGNASIYVGGRRRFTGSSAAKPLRDVWGFGGGASVRASKLLTVGADYDWQQSSAITGTGPSSEVTGWGSFRLNSKARLMVYASKGFTTNSADFAGGMAISIRL
jgi:hypothetical protein